ncbi:MAG: alpha/beta hydrolase [Kangiellaceae bacterium]|nr:alpha/beta hydrolase [Kangiellaceae bacterium]
MKTYILVHGAWGGAWEFETLTKLLSESDTTVIAVDLPGHGEDQTPLSGMTMAAYINKVEQTINEQSDPVILVGHSLAGAVISQVAETIPNKIDRLIYVAAMLPKSGDVPFALMQSDEDGLLLANTTFSQDQTIATLKPSVIEEILFHDVEDKSILHSIIPKMTMQQSTDPFMAVSELSEDNFGSVKKYYIRASIDKVLSPRLQQRMLENWPVEDVATLPSGHFPLTSMPERLAETIKQMS